MSFADLLNRTAQVIDVGDQVVDGILTPGATPVATIAVRVRSLNPRQIVYDEGGSIVTDHEILTDSQAVELGHELTIDGERFVVAGPPMRRDGAEELHHVTIPARKIKGPTA